MKPKYKEGDWVRWMKDGHLVIGAVVYAKDGDENAVREPYCKAPNRTPHYHTDIGTVYEDQIIDNRVKFAIMKGISESIALKLKRIIDETGFSTAPSETKRVGQHFEAIIKIDDDNSAFITMTDESMDKLQDLQE